MPTIAADLVVQSLGEGITDRDETHEGLSSRDHSYIIAHGRMCRQSKTSTTDITIHRNVKDLAAEGFPSRDDQVEPNTSPYRQHRQHRHSGWQTPGPHVDTT
jgi:hypothetical protein